MWEAMGGRVNSAPFTSFSRRSVLTYNKSTLRRAPSKSNAKSIGISSGRKSSLYLFHLQGFRPDWTLIF